VYDDPLLMELGADHAIGHKLLPAPIEELVEVDEQYIVKTHDLPTDDKPAIYLVRDGRDSLVSFARYIQSFEQSGQDISLLRKMFRRSSFHDSLKELISSNIRYGGWGGNVMSWIHRRNGKTHVLKFEDLITNPDICLDNALRDVGVNIGDGQNQIIPTFDELHSKWPAFFRKGVVGGWQKEMPESLHELFWEHHGEAMKLLGYER